MGRRAVWVVLSWGGVGCLSAPDPSPETSLSGGPLSGETGRPPEETGQPEETGTPTDPRSQLRWVTTIGGPGDELVSGLVVRGDGSVAVAGSGGPAVGLDEGLPTEVQLLGSAPQVWWAIWGPDGQLRTAIGAAAGPGEAGWAQGIAEAPGGDLYVVGQLDGPATFGTQVLSPPTQDALFLARYAEDGTLVWLRDAPCAGTCRIASVESFADGSLLVGGAFTGSLILGPGDPRQATLISAGDTEDGFIAHYTAGGAILTGLHVPSVGGSVVTALEREVGGDILAAVALSGRTTLGQPGDPGRVVLDAPAEGVQVAVARYLLDASLDAVLPLGGAGDDVPRSLWALDDGGFALAGSFAGSLSADGLALQSLAGSDAMVLRYSAAWSPLAITQLGGGGDELGAAVVGQPDGSLWVAGTLCGGVAPCSVTAGVGAAAPVELYDLDGSTGFVAALSEGGEARWVWLAGGGLVTVGALGADPSGGVIGGNFEDRVIVGAGGPDAQERISGGGSDGLVVALIP